MVDFQKIRAGDDYNLEDSLVVTGNKAKFQTSGTSKQFASQQEPEIPHLAFASGLTLTDRSYEKGGVISYNENGKGITSKFYDDRSDA